MVRLSSTPIRIAMLAALLAACGDEPLIDRPVDPARIDTFQQIKASSIDILFVIDNSRSMTEEQEALAANFSRFLDLIDPDPTVAGEKGEVDYRIAVTTTDALNDEGEFLGSPKIISPSTPDPLAAAQANVAAAGSEGGALEQGLYSAELALERAKNELDGSGNPLFLRPKAFLYIIIVSDEEDGSFGEVRGFQRKFEQLKGLGNENMVAVSAIAGPVPDGCETAVPGVRYQQLADLTGGVLGSICTQDWAQTLEDLALSGIGLRKRFQLSEPVRDLMMPEGLGAEDFYEVSISYPCDTTDDDAHLAEESCYEVKAFCPSTEKDRPSGKYCLPYPDETGKDGWRFDERENVIEFAGRKSIPGPGSTVFVRYQPRDK